MENTVKRFLEAVMDEEIVSDVLHEMANVASRFAINCRAMGDAESRAASEGWELAAKTIRQASEKLES